MVRVKFSFILLLLIYSCDSGRDKIVGKYELVWIDLLESQTIYESEGSTLSDIGIPEYVFSVGHDENFIIAKQHPTNGFKGNYKVNSEITNFYIINMNKEVNKENKVIGPLTKVSFDSVRHALSIESIEFDLTFPEMVR